MTRLCAAIALTLAVLIASANILSAAPPEAGTFVGLPEKEGSRDVYLHKRIELPSGEILRAWTAISAVHEYVLYINGHEASRSRYGRVASSFRRAEEIEDLAAFFQPGHNLLVMKVHRWSPGKAQAFLKAEVQLKSGEETIAVAVDTDDSWSASYEAESGWTTADFRPSGWQPVEAVSAGRLGPRIPGDRRQAIEPDVAPPLPPSAKKVLPQIAELSDWSQYVVSRDMAAETERLMGLFQTRFVAETYARAIQRRNSHMGDSYNISGYPVGNGLVFTTIGPYPFHNSTWTLGPEYQYPVQWNPGSTFAGDRLAVHSAGQTLRLDDQWMGKIRGTDVVVTAASDASGNVVFHTLTFAPPKLKALLRIYAVANTSDSPLEDVVVTNSVLRTKVVEKTLVETVKHVPIADAQGDANTRTMITGLLDDLEVTPRADEATHTGSLGIHLGDVAPGECRTCLVYHVTYLETVNQQPVESDAEGTLAVIRDRGYGLLDDTIQYWRDYNASTTTLEAPGAWGRRAGDFIDDVKMLVQVQQFERTGAVGPMWFFSDQWIRDSCGPVRSFLRTGRFEEARRVLDYHYGASVACRKILNWLPMDVDVNKPWPEVEDWSEITVSHADRHANCEVPSWVILQHYWYFQYTGDRRPIVEHWPYLVRCFYGQFDNPTDNVFRPDFKIPFHGDETYIYSGGEGLWNDRYDLGQSSYPGGNMHSADSSFALAAAGDALAVMARALDKDQEATEIAQLAEEIRKATEDYYWMEDLGFYAQGMSRLFDGQLNRYPMANIAANVVWSGYGDPDGRRTVSNALRMTEYLMEESGVLNPVVGYDVTVGMLQGQGLYSLAAVRHPWAEKAFYALLMIAGDTTEFSEWMAPGADFRTMYRANRIRPWEAGINLDAALYFLSGFEPDAPNARLTLTPRLPGGVYSPIRWDRMTLNRLPVGRGAFDLAVADEPHDKGGRQRVYTLTSRSQDDLSVTLNALVPFARIDRVEVNGRALLVQTSQIHGQALAEITAPLPAGKTLRVDVRYRPGPVEPVKVDLKPFHPPPREFDSSDVVIFTAARPAAGRTLLRDELAKSYRVVGIDATLPTDPETFEAALLTQEGLRTKMLILGEGTMASGTRKNEFWWDPRFDQLMGRFLRRGGVVLELGSRNASSRWLEKTLAPARFEVDLTRSGDILALDEPDSELDRRFSWIDEKQAQACGKWSGYWAGSYTMNYLGGGPAVTDQALIWGHQEQPHGCMQYTMKSTPGRDHLIRVRSWPRPRKGFTLHVTEDQGKTWKEIETVWVPQPEDPNENGWIDVYLTLPAEYVTGETTVFRLGPPRGSSGGIGHPSYASTGAARIWLRDDLEKPPSMAQIDTSSAVAAALGLPSEGIVAYSTGLISFDGFTAPYRILGDSGRAALIVRPVGEGVYVKSEISSLFPVEQTAKLITALIDSRSMDLDPFPVAD